MSTELPAIQAAVVPGSKRPGRSGIYRNTQTPKDISEATYKVKTPVDCFVAGLKANPNANCLGHREWDFKTNTWGPYIWESYEEIRRRRDDFGAGLMRVCQQQVQGLRSSQFNVGILSINRKEWIIADLGLQVHNLTSVALYDTLGPDTTEYIVNLCEMPVIIASLDNIPKLLSIRAKIPCLKVIVSMDSLAAETSRPGYTKGDLLRSWAEPLGVHVIDFKAVEALGRANPLPHNLPKPSDIFTINFTSGTTGMPKGVVITHANAAATASSVAEVMFKHSEGPQTVLSYLPLAHIYERANIIVNFLRGGETGMYHGDILGILSDIQELKPTVFASVPRLLLRIEAAIRAQSINAPGIRGAISRKAWGDKLAKMEAGGDQYHMIWDRLWSRKINKVLGGRIQLILSGSAPLQKETTMFLRAAFACAVIEGYGMTETMAAATVGHPLDFAAGHVGPPIGFTEVCLLDVPEMNYSSNDKPYPRGELLIRCASRFKEYYKEPAKTKETIDEEGWLHTGDVAMIDDVGRVYIIDRVKNIFKLAHGEYIAAERIEGVYQGCLPVFAQLFIHGDSTQSHLVALGSVEPAAFAALLSKLSDRQILPTDLEALNKACKDIKIRKVMLDMLGQVATEKKLNGFERVKNIHLAIEPFTIENGTLTPSFKLKRPQALKLYRRVFDDLYSEAAFVVPAKL